MDFFSRKLLSDDEDDLNKFCKNCRYVIPDHCSSDCLEKCSDPCSYFPIPIPASKSPHKLSSFVTATIALISFTFLLVLCYAIYARFYSGRRIRRRGPDPPPPPPTTHQQEFQFLDEEHGPVLDHPIWYIRTVGLPPAVIDAIAVCRFKSGEGLIDGTECSVCLSEFEEDETLRLLPKCSHAFHLPCIDMWLRSHTNCPMCRAPVVAPSAAAASPPPPPPAPLATSEETQMRDLEREVGDGANLGEISNEEQEQEQHEIHLPDDDDDDSEESVGDFQPMRRSVSLDSLSALRISSVFGDVNEKMDCKGAETRNESKKSSSCAMNRSVSCSGKFLVRSSTQRSSGTNHS